jgi:hypothetical protein
MRQLRLHVIAPNAADLIGSAGGWLCDRALAGWHISATLTDTGDTTERALNILGAALHYAAPEPQHLPYSIAIMTRPDANLSAILHFSPELLRECHEVTILGTPCIAPVPTAHRLRPIRHQVSVAARAFKAAARAVLSSADQERPSPFEYLHSGHLPASPPGAANSNRTPPPRFIQTRHQMSQILSESPTVQTLL